jgi:transcriptional regulator with XRE-family HTH domain
MIIDIRSVRIQKGIRQRDLAHAVGVSGHTMRKWERGFESPDPPQFEKLAEVLAVDPNNLGTPYEIHS